MVNHYFRFSYGPCEGRCPRSVLYNSTVVRACSLSCSNTEPGAGAGGGGAADRVVSHSTDRGSSAPARVTNLRDVFSLKK